MVIVNPRFLILEYVLQAYYSNITQDQIVKSSFSRIERPVGCKDYQMAPFIKLEYLVTSRPKSNGADAFSQN